MTTTGLRLFADEADLAAPSDAEALADVATGKVGALAMIYARHQRSIYRFALQATSHPQDAEDIAHATFMTAAKAAGSFDGRPSCRPWLLGIAARLLARRRRSLGRCARAIREFTVLHDSLGADPHRELVSRDELTAVCRAVKHLSEPKRIVLLLAEVEQLTCDEIASMLHIPVGTVWTRLHHARQDLRRAALVLEPGDR
jgi:RNA polymerase sigma factor (sigma-70 family)